MSRAARLAAVVAAYAALAVAFTWPLATLWHTYLVGDQELPAFMWRAWWMQCILRDGWSLAATWWDGIAVLILSAHYPEAGNLNDMALGLALQSWLGFPACHNVKCFLILLFNALAGYLLGRQIGGSRAAGFVGGAVLAFNPYVAEMINIGRLREAIVGFEALAALFLWRMLARDGGVRDAVGAGACAALTAIFYWFYGHYVLLLAVVLGLWRLLALGLRPRLVLARDVALCAWVAAILVLPFAAPYLCQARSGRMGDDVADAAVMPSLPKLVAWHNPDDREALVLNSRRRLLSESRQPEYALDFQRPDSLPLVVVLLALTGAVVGGSAGRCWLAGALLFYSMSLGPYLRWHGSWITRANGEGIPLPHAFFYGHLPLFWRLYAPNRAESMLLVCLAALVALALGTLFARTACGRPERIAAVAIVLLGILAPMWLTRQLPLRFIPARMPQTYRTLAAIPGPGAVLELPAEASRDDLNFYQTLHQRRLVGGWATRPPTPLTPRWRELAGTFQREAQAARELEKGVTVARLQDARGQGVRFLVLHERFFLQQDPSRGTETYRDLCAALQRHLGAPLAVDREAAPERNAFLPPGWGEQPIPPDSELRVYDLNRLGGKP